MATIYTNTCKHLLNNGLECGRLCARETGCSIHYNRPFRYPCSRCGRPTAVVVNGQPVCTRKHAPLEKFSCPYLSMAGVPCGAPCRRSLGCSRHYPRHPRGFCSLCGDVTSRAVDGVFICGRSKHSNPPSPAEPAETAAVDSCIDEILGWDWGYTAAPALTCGPDSDAPSEPSAAQEA